MLAPLMMLHFASTACLFSFRASFCSHSVLQSDSLPEHQWLWVRPCPCNQPHLFPGLSLLFLEWEERDSLLTGGSLQSPDRTFLANTFFFFSLVMGCDYSLAVLISLHVTCLAWMVLPLAPLVKHSILSVPPGPQLAFLVRHCFPHLPSVLSNFRTVTLNYRLGP